MQKAWYQDKDAITAILTALVGLYAAFRNSIPALPEIPEGVVAALVVILGAVGLFNRGTDKNKPKLAMFRSKGLQSFILAAMLLGVTVPAHADLFGNRAAEQKLRANAAMDEVSNKKVSASLVDAWSPADILAGLAGKLGAKLGAFFDFENEEFVSYLATTLWTSDNGIALNVGMIGTDGAIASVDWNIGAAISQEDVPIISLFEYLYIGYGAGYRDPDSQDVDLSEAGDWKFVHGPTLVFKATF